jgi:hypothetical protein
MTISAEQSSMTQRDREEYSALRDTIRERGTTRVWIVVVGTIGWAGSLIATAALAPTPLAVFVPLLVLVATFEAIFALHVGVERIGRYLQVFHETEPQSDSSVRPIGQTSRSDLGWEHAAMSFGRPKGAARIDALFTLPIALAALFNLVPALLIGPSREEVVFVAGGHALFLLRLFAARAVAARQRAIDLARFETLRVERSRPSSNTAS